jgi:hypothetical protein
MACIVDILLVKLILFFVGQYVGRKDKKKEREHHPHLHLQGDGCRVQQNLAASGPLNQGGAGFGQALHRYKRHL